LDVGDFSFDMVETSLAVCRRFAVD